MIKLKEMRQARGMTQTELANRVRHADPTADQVTISVLERGQLYPSQKLRDAICEALDCDEADIYDGVEALFVPAEETEISDTTRMLGEIFAAWGGHTITRVTLRGLLQEWAGFPVSDRRMREWIAQARDEGMVIANAQNGLGYFLPRTLAEFEAQLSQMENRTMKQLRQMKHIRKKIREMRS